ncbi:MAG TPA: hypothetical protein VJZ93_02150 [Candidatus Nanoarchaeia archaeon]|nr:hypothetical protein [Candidatus Nanoarchaeia archaeon]
MDDNLKDRKRRLRRDFFNSRMGNDTDLMGGAIWGFNILRDDGTQLNKGRYDSKEKAQIDMYNHCIFGFNCSRVFPVSDTYSLETD